jgi:hypothetical protein
LPDRHSDRAPFHRSLNLDEQVGRLDVQVREERLRLALRLDLQASDDVTLGGQVVAERERQARFTAFGPDLVRRRRRNNNSAGGVYGGRA